MEEDTNVSSIFVCFRCECEFKDVTELYEHMSTHDDEDSDEPQPPKKAKVAKAFKTSKTPNKTSTFAQNVQKHLPKVIAVTSKPKITPKMPSSTKNMPKGSAYNATLKSAMRLRQYILLKEKNSKTSTTPKENNPVDAEDEEFSNPTQEPKEDYEVPGVMMLDSNETLAGNFSAGDVEGFSTTINPKIKNKKIIPSGSRKSILSLGFEEEEDNPSKISDDNFLMVGGFEYKKEDYMTKSTVKKRGRKPKYIKEEYDYLEMDEMEEYENVESWTPSKKFNGRRDSNDEDANFACPECGKKFRSPGVLKTHMKIHSEVKELNCPFCEEVFPQRHCLHEHIIMEHESESTNLICPQCQKVFTRRDSLKTHILRMHSENGGITCQVCNKNFPSQAQLETHVRVHTGERPFKCELCNKSFVQKVHLKTHLRSMHNIKDAINCTLCRICNTMVDSRMALKDHCQDAHNMSIHDYKARISKLRREGKLQEVPPSRVKVVDPSFRYHKVNLSDIDKLPSGMQMVTNNTLVTRKKVAKKRGPKPKYATAQIIEPDCNMFSPTYMEFKQEREEEEGEVDEDGLEYEEDINCQDNSKNSKQVELSIVESAFKAVEQMEKVNENSQEPTLLVTGDGNNLQEVFYAIPVVMSSTESHELGTTNTITNGNTHTFVTTLSSGVTQLSTGKTVNATIMDDMDDEYAQFAAEHAHMSSDAYVEDIGIPSEKGSIVKAEPLQILSENGQTGTQTIEMLTM